MLVQADASQLEWRTLLELSRDEIGLREILEGQDTHELNRVAFNLPSRLISKIYLFRTIYRGKGWSFANDPAFMHVSSSASFWDEINEKFYKKYKGIDRCHKDWADCVLKGRSIVGPFGREWEISLARDIRGNLVIPWTILTNYPVQGTGADIMQIARVSFINRLKKQPWGDKVLLISTVHDSIVVDAPSYLVQDIVNLFHQVFDDLIGNFNRLFNYTWIVPLTCECKFGMNMKEMTKIPRNDI